MELIRIFLNLVFPRRCYICGKLINTDKGLCADCCSDIKFIGKPFCSKCGKPFLNALTFEGVEEPICLNCREKKLYFEYARSLGAYDGVLKDCIHLVKYKGKRIILNDIAGLARDQLKDLFGLEKISFILPVPLHKKRLRERGFNQSGLFANLLGNIYSIPVNENALSRISFSVPQTKLGSKERAKNIEGAFCAEDIRSIENSNILLIDDVYTTGSTVNECAKVLKRAKASNVYVFTIAHAV